MKRLLILLFLIAPMLVKAQPAPVIPANQAEVNAGVIHTKFVAPDTLAGFSSAGISASTATNIVKSLASLQGYAVLVHNGATTAFSTAIPLESANASALPGDAIELYNSITLSNQVRNTNIAIRGHDCVINDYYTNADGTVAVGIVDVGGSVCDLWGSMKNPVSPGQALIGMNDNHGDPPCGNVLFRNISVTNGDSDGLYWSDTTNNNDVVTVINCTFVSKWDTAALFGTNNIFTFYNCNFTNSGVSVSTAGGAILRGFANIDATATLNNCILGVGSVTNTAGTSIQSAMNTGIPPGFATNFVNNCTFYVGGAQTNTVGINAAQGSQVYINGCRFVNTTTTNGINAVVGVHAQTAGTQVFLRSCDIFGSTGLTNIQLQVAQAPSLFYDASSNIKSNLCYPLGNVHFLYGGGDIGTLNSGAPSEWVTNLYILGALNSMSNTAALGSVSNVTLPGLGYITNGMQSRATYYGGAYCYSTAAATAITSSFFLLTNVISGTSILLYSNGVGSIGGANGWTNSINVPIVAALGPGDYLGIGTNVTGLSPSAVVQQAGHMVIDR